jgi:hypothetical protein
MDTPRRLTVRDNEEMEHVPPVAQTVEDFASAFRIEIDACLIESPTALNQLPHLFLGGSPASKGCDGHPVWLSCIRADTGNRMKWGSELNPSWRLSLMIYVSGPAVIGEQSLSLQDPDWNANLLSI